MPDTDSMGSAEWLLCDADDTLWENNIFFEEAIREFIEFVDHPVMTAVEVRQNLDRVETRNIKVHGYGAKNFARNLLECFEGLRGHPASSDERRLLARMTDLIVNAPIEPIPGVPETLSELRSRHRLGLVTKGDRAEQHSKLDRSGLADAFEYVANVPEKDAECYRTVVREVGADPSCTWMIGNSPKSDINPALEAGLGAVLVHNENTWRLEMQALPARHERFRLVDRFSDLTSIF